MNTRFGGIVIAWALVLVTVWLGDRLYHSYVYVVDEPKLVVPEGKLRDWEKSNIELFQAAGGSVAYMTTEQVRFNPFRGVIVAQGAGSGFIWDKAGHVVTNFHVIDGANTVYVQLHAGDSMRAGRPSSGSLLPSMAACVRTRVVCYGNARLKSSLSV
jgi:2-alkenal reductase